MGYSDGGRLPAVGRKVREVVEMLGGQCFAEGEATRARLIAEAPHHDLIHLAAHGEARPDHPEFAHLKLADGQLSMADVFNLGLDGALVTLSACETGRSVVTGGDELIGLADEYDTLILEDDAYGELRFEGETLPPLFALDHGSRVIRAGTLSKILGAGVRLGWLCAPRAMIPAFQSFLFGGGVNPFMSRVATYYLREHLDAHVRLLIDVYRAKRDAMLAGLDELLAGSEASLARPEGGFFLWLQLPRGVDQGRLAALAGDAGVQYTPGPVFYANGGGEELIRLAFSYEPPEKCYEGARLLGKAILGARAS